MMTKRATFLKGEYTGYQGALDKLAVDKELTQVGPGTPGGEYLRRFWHPIAFTANLEDVPVRTRVLGEDLALFKDKSGRIGLLALNCSHRGTSLEFGIIQDRGIMCCYHGWVFDVNGKILETPGEPNDSTLKDKLWHGAYPVREYKGLVFAYMGPADEQPPFPVYDSFELDNYKLVPWGGNVLPCNWIQVKENAMDPVHTSFLHSINFTGSFGIIPEIDFRENPLGMMYVGVRRIDGNVWVRSTEMIMPNLHQLAPTFETGETPKDFSRPMQSIWAVPLDDTHTMNIGFNHYDEINPPDMDKFYMGTDFGQMPDRSYRDRQLQPGDYDAQISLGETTIHAREHLGATDRGVSLFRRLVHQGIRDVAAGRDPVPEAQRADGPISTYAHDTIQPAPMQSDPEVELAQLRSIGKQVTDDVIAGKYPR